LSPIRCISSRRTRHRSTCPARRARAAGQQVSCCPVAGQEFPSLSVHRPDANRQPRCALRSDDTDARKATVARFGRSHRRAQLGLPHSGWSPAPSSAAVAVGRWRDPRRRSPNRTFPPEGQRPAVGDEGQADPGVTVASQPRPLPTRGEVPEEELVVENPRNGLASAWSGGRGSQLQSPGRSPPLPGGWSPGGRLASCCSMTFLSSSNHSSR
jgi:hypothetical protein